MTATPIPRTLAVILFGDLDISAIDELPPGRKAVETKAVTARQRKKVYEFAGRQIEEGRQVYVVAPLIEDSETVDASSAVALYHELQGVFPGRNVAFGSRRYAPGRKGAGHAGFLPKVRWIFSPQPWSSKWELMFPMLR